MKYQAEFRKEYFGKLKKEGHELNGQIFVQMEKDLYIEWLETKLQNTSPNNDYMKCLDDIWDIVSVNLRSGKWDKSEFGEILKKHFA